MAIYSPKGTHDVTFLDNYTNVFVKDALSRTKGVGDVISRADDFSMRIWLKPDKLAALGMTAADVTAALTNKMRRSPPVGGCTAAGKSATL